VPRSKPKKEPGRNPGYILRLISSELGEETWRSLATEERLTPKEGYVEWPMDDYSERGNEVLDYLGAPLGGRVSWRLIPETDMALL